MQLPCRGSDSDTFLVDDAEVDSNDAVSSILADLHNDSFVSNRTLKLRMNSVAAPVIILSLFINFPSCGLRFEVGKVFFFIMKDLVKCLIKVLLSSLKSTI